MNLRRLSSVPLALTAVIVIAMTASCRHHLFDRKGRASLEADYASRMASFPKESKVVPSLDSLGLSESEKEVMKFLYAYMPLADIADYPPEFFLQNVRESFRAREEMPWGKTVPDLLFKHFVLPLRANNERLDSSRTAFYRELAPRVDTLSMQDAILEVNHWCHEKVTYRPSDARTSSPLESVSSAIGRCGEESTLTVAALRSVGIPARQVYTPRWAHTDDNHAWVEAWADGKWWFLGACEPEPVLNLGWFNEPASRALLMHTKVFGKYSGDEDVLLETPGYTEINLIGNYAENAPVKVTVNDVKGKGVDGARVSFCIYNYAEFYPAVTRYTGRNASVTLSAGLGDMLIWADHKGRYGFAKVSFGRDTEVTVTLSYKEGDVPEGFEYKVVPPAGKPFVPDVDSSLRAANDYRLAYEDSVRKAYEATFFTSEQAKVFTIRHRYPEEPVTRILTSSRGHRGEISDFLAGARDHDRALALLSSLSEKDLRDVPPPVLYDSYFDEGPLSGPRVENEFLWPFKAVFREYFGKAPLGGGPAPSDAFSNGSVSSRLAAIKDWIQKHITLETDPLAWNIPASPAGTLRALRATPRSRDIFFVALARTFGIDARKDPVTGQVQYRENPSSGWIVVEFQSAGDRQGTAASAGKGRLKIRYEKNGSIDKPFYYKHFTISRITDGKPSLLEYDEESSALDYMLDEGIYMLVSGNRLADGSVPATVRFFKVSPGKTVTVPLELRAPEGALEVLGTFDSELKYYPYVVSDGLGKTACSILSVTGRGYYSLIYLKPGTEPASHILRDLVSARESLESWGRNILIMTGSEAEMKALLKEVASIGEALPGTVVFGVDTDSSVRTALAAVSSTEAAALPQVIIADTFNRVVFIRRGYTIGLGDTLASIVARL